ncbi:MAG: HU family DNA-binding protein [Paracoccus aminovorans]|nr:HU family DNA-binding protein [Paracoccus aminovorans]
MVAAVAGITGRTKKEAEEMVAAVFAIIREEADAGKTVSIPGFGRFGVVDRPAREARNPRTGESIQIAAKRSLKFKAAKTRT